MLLPASACSRRLPRRLLLPSPTSPHLKTLLLPRKPRLLPATLHPQRRSRVRHPPAPNRRTRSRPAPTLNLPVDSRRRLGVKRWVFLAAGHHLIHRLYCLKFPRVGPASTNDSGRDAPVPAAAADSSAAESGHQAANELAWCVKQTHIYKSPVSPCGPLCPSWLKPLTFSPGHHGSRGSRRNINDHYFRRTTLAPTNFLVDRKATARKVY